MSTATKTLVRRAAFSSGALGAMHRRRNAGSLTVVTFHRVLAGDDPRWAAADPRYTMSRSLFAECLAFFRDRYSVVTPQDVLAAGDGAALPERALLVTIDDGWADTHEHALPELVRAHVRALVFVAADAIDAPEPFWQERVVAAYRTGRLDVRALAAPDAEALVARLGRMSASKREHWLRDCLPRLEARSAPRLGTAAQMRAIAEAGMTIGGHGASHEPLAGHPDLEGEITASRDELVHLIGPLGNGEPSAMSFPHGAYDQAAVRVARASGYRLLFTSDTCLNALAAGRLTSDVVGRVGVPADAITGTRGKLSPDQLARWLWLRPRQTLQVA